MGTSSDTSSSSDEGFFSGTFDDPGEPGFSGPSYEGQNADPSQDRREDPNVPGKTYNFNINRAADYSVDEQGRRVYDTLDPAMQKLYEASGQFATLDQLDNLQRNFDLGTISYLTADNQLVDKPTYDDAQQAIQMDVDENMFAALDAAYSNPKYADRLKSYVIDPETGKYKVDAKGNYITKGDLNILMRENQDVLVEDPNMFDQFMTKAGAAFANTVAGQLGGALIAPLAFKLSPGAVGANLGFQTGQFLGQRGLFGIDTQTFSARAWENPLTGENVTEQVFSNPATGEEIRTFTTASEFAERAAEEEALKEKYESGDAKGNATAFSKAVTGTRKPSWRDYVNTDFGSSFYNNLVGGGALDTLSEPIRDSIVLGKIISEGGDPLSALVTTFGDDVDEMLGLSDLASESLDKVFDPETAQFIRDNRDLAQLGADIVVYGKDPSQAIVERYGSGILDYLGADTKNQRALGQAALNVGVALDQGVDRNQAVGQGIIDYFRQGGTVDALDVDSFTQPLKDFAGDVDLSFDWLSLPNVDWPTAITEFNLNANDLLSKVPNPFSWIDTAGIPFDQFDWQGLKDSIDLSQFTFDDFFSRGITLDDMEAEGISLTDIDPDIDVGEMAFNFALEAEKYPGQYTTSDGEYVQPLTYDLDLLANDEETLARQMLKKTYS
jgi:hypothetical protein